MLVLGVMRRQMLLPRLVFREESQMFQFLMVILENTLIPFYKANGSLSGMRQQTTNYMRFIHSWVFGLEVLESLGVKRVF